MLKIMRTRFAPSPTGPPHLGMLRTALFAWLAARKMNGRFVLRIDDTDRERSEKSWEEMIFDALRYLEIDWDEGPDIGGSFGPYRQSQRTEEYRKAIDRLKSDRQLYPCFCTEAELNIKRAAARASGKPYVYDGKCRSMNASEIENKISAGEEHTWRFHVDTERFGESIEFKDLVWGDQNFRTELIGDFVCIRGDGKPTYNLVSPIDDAKMEISHIIRGADHIPNTPLHIMIMKALGYSLPEFAHLPLIMGPGGKKLSKRDSLTGLSEIRKYLPDALINYIALLGWTHPEGTEILSRDELIKSFSFDRVSTSPSAHDPARLKYPEREHLHRMNAIDIFKSWKKSSYADGIEIDDDKHDSIIKILSVVSDELTSLSSINDEILPITNSPTVQELTEAFAGFDIKEILPILHALLKSHSENRFERLHEIAEGSGKKTAYLPVRIALTGKRRGFEIRKLFDAFPEKELNNRLELAIEVLENIQGCSAE
ncbi:MAG: glutamate--tRNA ligase [bacterium]